MHELTSDVAILGDLTKRYLEICNEGVQKERRDLWRRHNSLKPTRPLIYVRAFAWSEMQESRYRPFPADMVSYDFDPDRIVKWVKIVNKVIEEF